MVNTDNGRAGEAQSQSNQAAHAVPLDEGDIKLIYRPRKSMRAGFVAHRAVGDTQALQSAIADLNGRIALPFDINVSVQDCDGPDAFYDPDKREVAMCYQLIDEYYALFSRKVKDKAALDAAVRGATAATFFHELGHALIDAWKLPVTGKEEDAVDQLSTLVLINRTEQGEQMALYGARMFELYADLGKGEEKVFWDEHSLDEQRFYDTICLIYGHDPEKYAYLVKEGTLPEERAEMCREDYPRVSGSWQQLLAAHVKK